MENINGKCFTHVSVTLMVYSYCLGPEPGPGQEPGPVLCRTFHIAPELGRMGCMVLIRTFHTAPEEDREEH